MNATKLLVTILAIALLVVWGCERKVVVNEINNNNGLSGADACMECHGDQDLTLQAAQAQWDRSKHAEATTSVINANIGDGNCERCHTAEGFLAFVTGEPFDSSHYSSIGCFTCHEPHTTGNLGVRVTSAVTLGNGEVFDQGQANLCVTCHHSRRNINTYVSDSVKLSSHYGPHYSNQGDLLIGTGGYEYAGHVYGNSPHGNTTEDGCINCHMSPSIGLAMGGHTFAMTGLVEGEDAENTVGCNVPTCHDGDVEDFNWGGYKSEIEALMDSLGTELIDAGLMNAEHQPTNGLIVKSKDSTGALFNYRYIYQDRSSGIHNPDYAIGLLRSALNFMLYHDPNGVVGAPRMVASH